MDVSKDNTTLNKVTFQKPTRNPFRSTVRNFPVEPRFQRQEFSSQGRSACFRCGRSNHKASDCIHFNAVCYTCHKTGHLSTVCVKKGKGYFSPNSVSKTDNTNYVGESSNDENIIDLFTVGYKNDNRYMLTAVIEGVPIRMEVDSGATKSIIGSDNWDVIKLANTKCKLYPSQAALRSFSGQLIKPLGQTKVHVTVENTSHLVNLIVTEGNKPSLFGRDWMDIFGFEILRVNSLDYKDLQKNINGLLQKHKLLFQPGVGKLIGVKAHINLKENAQPRFCKPRTVPYALRPKVEEELSRLVEQGILEPVSTALWAAPIVVVPKADGNVRICGDFSQTINPESRIDQYPLPTVEDIVFKIHEDGGGEKISLLDVSHAYEHLELDEQSQEYVVINTHKGLFKYTRVPYGLASGPALFQKAIEELLASIKCTGAFMDDILASGRDVNHHIEVLDNVLTRLESANVRLNKEKCKFLQDEVKYLGFMINKEGLKPTKDILDAIQSTPSPTNVTELKAYTGLLTFYGRFLPHMATDLEPLYRLHRSKVPWYWGPEQQKSFDASKEWLNSSQLLVHFDPRKPIIVSCDASPYGIGAVLSHSFTDGQERRVTSSSRTLNETERRYSQLDKEALALVFAVAKFHKYLYGHKFVLTTDHKPLLGLFGKNKKIPEQASPRIIRWAIILSAYDFDLQYRKGSDNQVADALSRMPTVETINSMPEPAGIMLLEQDNDLIQPQILIKETNDDPVLKVVRESVITGDSLPVKEVYKAYSQRWRELSTLRELVLWGDRVIVPFALREHTLNLLHEGHHGMVKMKQIARSHLWWPGLDKEIENKVKGCLRCQMVRHDPAKEKPIPWPSVNEPWSRVHLDHAGPFHNRIFLLAVDAYSRWIEVKLVPSTSAEHTATATRDMFAAHGLPCTIVTDNHGSYTGATFQQFLKRNGVKHVLTPPFHPASNGIIERVVQTVKQGLNCIEGKDWRTKIARLLFHYRSTPHSSTGRSPAELFLGRKFRTHWNQVANENPLEFKPESNGKVVRSFPIGAPVWIRNYSNPSKWKAAVIQNRSGQVLYEVRVADGSVFRRHINQMRPRDPQLLYETGNTGTGTCHSELSRQEGVEIDDVRDTCSPAINIEAQEPNEAPEPHQPDKLGLCEGARLDSEPIGPVNTTSSPIVIRRSNRVRKAPDRLKF